MACVFFPDIHILRMLLERILVFTQSIHVLITRENLRRILEQDTHQMKQQQARKAKAQNNCFATLVHDTLRFSQEETKQIFNVLS